MAAVHRYEGTVNQVLGDGIMALFGAPLAHEDHAVRACYAALAMQEAIQRYAAEVRRAHGIEVQIRVGINSGRWWSAPSATTYTWTTPPSARPRTWRLVWSTRRGIRLTAETLRLAEGLVQVTALGPVPVKGLPEPVDVFELVGAVSTRTRLQALRPAGSPAS